MIGGLRVPGYRFPPTYLYKYRSLAGAARKFTEQIFRDCSLYWPSPLEVNDPFDCYPALVDLQPEEVREQGRKAVLERRADELRRQGNSVVVANTPMPSRQLVEQRLQAQHASWRCKVGICSLSARYDDILMWSHYADSHRGICLQFRSTNQLVPHFLYSHRVRHEDERPMIDLFDDSDRDWPLVEKNFLIKAKHWEYEQEWRMIDQVESGPHPFPVSDLTSVILGALISPEDEAAVRKWAGRYCKPDRIFKAIPNGRVFRLDVAGLPTA